MWRRLYAESDVRVKWRPCSRAQKNPPLPQWERGAWTIIGGVLGGVTLGLLVVMLGLYSVLESDREYDR